MLPPNIEGTEVLKVIGSIAGAIWLIFAVGACTGPGFAVGGAEIQRLYNERVRIQNAAEVDLEHHTADDKRRLGAVIEKTSRRY